MTAFTIHRDTAVVVDEAIEILVEAGFAPISDADWVDDGWWSRFDGFRNWAAGEVMTATVVEGDGEIVFGWFNKRGVALQPTVRVPVSAHGRRLAVAIAKA